jgi:hypothetical protein
MNTIKSFNDFDKSNKKVEEELFRGASQKRAERKVVKNLQNDDSKKVRGVRGKEVFRDQTGKKHKVVWKAQDTNNFIVKLVADYQWLDPESNLNLDGQSAILQFLNGENSFVNQYGKLDGAFFSKNIIVYSVKRDTDRRQKIQFSIVDRATIMAKIKAASQEDQTMLNLEGLNFINASQLVAIDNQISTNIQTNLEKTILNVPSETEETGTEETGTDEVDVIPVTDVSLIGKKFEYQSGADGKIYIVTVEKNEETGGLKFWAKSKDGTKEGWVLLKEEEPIWDEKGRIVAITNTKDREFFIRVYADSDYLKSLTDAFEKKYPEGFDFTIKDILYYSDGTKIYSTGGSGSNAATTANAAAAAAFLALK